MPRKDDNEAEQGRGKRRSTRLRSSNAADDTAPAVEVIDDGDDEEDIDSESEDTDDEFDDKEGSGRPQRNKNSITGKRKATRSNTRSSFSKDDNDDDDDGSNSDGSTGVRRKSKRTTKFQQSMKEPAESIADLLRASPVGAKGGGRQSSGGSNRRGTRTRGEIGSSDEDSESRHGGRRSSRTRSKQQQSYKKQTTLTNLKQPKSPAVRHTTKRHRKRLEIPVSDESEESSSSEEDSSDPEEDEGELKVQRIIACRSETVCAWREICNKMNTSEIENGSRWFQDDSDSDSDDDSGNGKPDNTFQERYLVKWSDLSYLHCSWELENDLMDQVENSKTYLTSFFRRSENGLLFTADERGDGEYFDPSWVQVDRILEIQEPEQTEEKTVGKSSKRRRLSDTENTESSKHGIILDKEHPDYESGTGRQFLVKWGNTAYSECTYEFERDLILNEVEYEEEVESFCRRSKKPNKSDMNKALNSIEHQTRRLYKIFGEKLKLDEKEREGKIKDYQTKLTDHVFPNGGQLRDYQSEGVSWLMSNHVNKRSSILADEMGLGKTIQTAVYVNTVATTLGSRGPFLIVAPLSTVPHWSREFTSWTELNTIVYHGSAADREYIREYEMAFERDRPTAVGFNQSFLKKCHPVTAPKWQRTWMAQVVITTPEMLVTEDFAELAAVRWEILVVDEAHRLKNHTSKLAANLRDDRFRFDRTLLLTGTPIQNNMSELWTLLNFIDRDSFKNIDTFLERYGDIKSKEMIDELHDRIRPYILRRLKEDVEKSVPPKEETLLEVELTVVQKQYYRALYEKNVQFLHRNVKKALDGPSINNLAMQLRKCCNHPFLLRGVEDELRVQEQKNNKSEWSEVDFLCKASGKLVLLDKLLPRLKKDGHRVLIFSQFKIMLDIIQDYLALRKMKAERIDGSITGNKRQRAIDRFQAEEVEGKEASFVMLLSTRAGGVGINLTAADTCIIFDSDWNPQNDLQAQARCHRIGQTKSVKVYRLLSRKSYEMQMFHMSSLKMGLDQAVLHGIENTGTSGGEHQGGMTKEEVERLLRHGAYDIFNEEKAGASEKESNDFVSQDIDEILARRSKTVVHENTGSKSNAKGGTFSKASFKATHGTSDAVDGVVEDVDIDDPDFWKKMVGEAQIADDTDLVLKKRKRKEANYSEALYEKKFKMSLYDERFPSSDEGAPSDAYESDESDSEDDAFERGRWGGKRLTEWEKMDAELLLRAIASFGYGNLSWDHFFGKLGFIRSPSYPTDEVKRMSWALVLTALREAAMDDVHDMAKRAERAAEKKRESGPTSDGGMLGKVTAESAPEGSNAPVLSGSTEVSVLSDDKMKEDQLERSFEKLLHAHSSWVSKAIEDALAYAQSNCPRSRIVINTNLAKKSNATQGKPPRELSPLTVAFNQNIWPALRSRGWKQETVSDPKSAKAQTLTRYNYKGEVYRSVSAVLDVAPKAHPELRNTVESIIKSVESEDALPSPESQTNNTLPSGFGANNVTAGSLLEFLQMYAPLQLMCDRMRTTKISVSRKIPEILSFLHTAHSLITSADKPCLSGIIEESKLLKLLSGSVKAALPHPAWNPGHDAILMNAIVKHGWIDRESNCRAITGDKSIKWGPPFDDGGEQGVANCQSSSPQDKFPELDEKSLVQLKTTASRATTFLNTEGDLIQLMKGFQEARVVKAYGITRKEKEESEDDDASPPLWIVDDALLQQGTNAADGEGMNQLIKQNIELPTRKDLLKRAKFVLSRCKANSLTNKENSVSATSTGKASTGDSQSNSFCVLDQSNRCNAFLVELLRGFLRFPLAGSRVATNFRRLIHHINREIESLLQSLSTFGDERTTSEIADMKKIQDHILFITRHLRNSTRQAKNVLRVILGIDPLPPKNPADGLFPVERSSQFTTMPVDRTSSSGSKQKTTEVRPVSEENRPRKFHHKERASGDMAINRALAAGTKIRDGVQTQENYESSLLLTTMETLLLSVICSQGLPVWEENWASLFESNTNPVGQCNHNAGSLFRISWHGMGSVAQTAAKFWHDAAVQKLTQKRSIQVPSGQHEQSKHISAIEELEREVKTKHRTMVEAINLNQNVYVLAKKSIMILEAVRKRMGQVDVNHGGATKKMKAMNKSEYGLGPRVLLWCGKELQRWAQSLQIIDDSGRPMSYTAQAYLNEKPEVCGETSWSPLDKKGCRTVFVQVSQQTRLRSIFMKNGLSQMNDDLIPKAVKNSRNHGDLWEKCPQWWGNNEDLDDCSPCKDDQDLLSGILNYGYSGFDEMLKEGGCFHKRIKVSSIGFAHYTTATHQCI